MDGAVVLSTDGTRITRANVHLVPDPSLPAVETGTRHRAAERTARHTGVPAVAVSASMTTVTVYAAGQARVLADPVVLLARADQTVATMERHGARTARARARLDRAEIGGYAAVRDVITMAQRLLRLERLGTELAELTVEMGEYGRQTTLQLEELLSDTPDELWGLVADYLVVDQTGMDPADADSPALPTAEQVETGLERLTVLSDADLLLPGPVARCLGLPAEPEDLDADALLRGLYRFRKAESGTHKASILASGVAMYAAVEAQKILAETWDVAADLWSATSWNELARDGFECERHELRHPDQQPRVPFVTAALADAKGPKVAVTDFQKAVPDQIRAWVPGDFTVLGCDGFGFSDTRPAARRFFNTDTESIIVAVLAGLVREGSIEKRTLLEAARQYQIDDVMAAPEPTTDPGVA